MLHEFDYMLHKLTFIACTRWLAWRKKYVKSYIFVHKKCIHLDDNNKRSITKF